MRTNLLKILNLIRIDGGVSYNINTGEANPTNGFMVGTGKGLILLHYVDKDVLSQFVKENAFELSKDNMFVGVWFDGNNYVLEVSENIKTKRDAVFFGIVRKQKSIWDCAKQDEIKIKSKEIVSLK